MATSDSTSTGPFPVRVFVSHSHYDRPIVQPLVELLQAACGFRPGAIRATSVDGSGLPVGSELDSAIAADILKAEVMIAVVTPASLASAYVRRELEERSAAGLPIMPIVAAGVASEQLPAPLQALVWVGLDLEVPTLIRTVSDALGIALRPAFIDEHQPTINRIVAAARRLHLAIPKLKSLERSFAPLIPDADENKLAFWSKVAFDGAEQLRSLMGGGGRNFEPQLVVALNQGGMVVSAMLSYWMSAPVGVAFTGIQRSRELLSLSLPSLKGVQRVLLVDTKLKTGDSVSTVVAALRDRLVKRKELDIRLAVLVAYGAWPSPRWEFPNDVRWPATLRLDVCDVLTYVAYHTTSLGLSDPYPEPWRDDIGMPGRSAEQPRKST